MDVTDSFLRAILATVARQTFPPSELRQIVTPKAGSDKQIAAYNLCDGNTPQSEIGTRTKLDKGNLSRLISRWIEAGIVIRVGAEQNPMHVYPLPPRAETAPNKNR
jgi:DNA-binding MarR family transcriptional regulator